MIIVKCDSCQKELQDTQIRYVQNGTWVKCEDCVRKGVSKDLSFPNSYTMPFADSAGSGQ